MDSSHTIEDLKMKQALSLSLKIALTRDRIRQWVFEYGVEGVFISYSGGKDSTVLLHIARELYPNMLAVFVDTGLEYPEIREFVKATPNVEWLKPKRNFKQTIEKYGYPFISKEVSGIVYGARFWLKKHGYFEDKEHLYDYREGGTVQYRQLMGKYETRKTTKFTMRYNPIKYQFFLEAPFEISNRCCGIMKKAPMHLFSEKAERHPITAQMASESRLRTAQWLQHGCNGFDMKYPISNPMSFWTEQDVLLYSKLYNVPLAPPYGNIILTEGEEAELSADKSILDKRPLLDTTGCKRTGCLFCGFGCHLEKPNDARFLRLKETHPQLYDYLMRPKEQGGLNYKEVIDWINLRGGFDIKY